MKYKKLIEKIVKEQLQQIPANVLKKFEKKHIKDGTEMIIHNSKMMYELECLQLDLDIQTINNEDIKNLTGKKLNHSELLKICKILKDINFKFEYVCNYGYCIDFFNYFDEVSYCQTQKKIKFLLSDKILLTNNL